jgi:hypothetical protein
LRSAGRVAGKSVQSVVAAPATDGAPILRTFFDQTVAPFLSGRAGRASPLRRRSAARGVFASLKSRVATELHRTVDVLENLCDRRRQFDLQARMHLGLHLWLCIHLPASAALFLLMFVHAYYAMWYW